MPIHTLRPDTREWWHELVEDEDDRYETNVGSLIGWLQLDVLPWLRGVIKARTHHTEILYQAFGQSLDPEKFNELGRWEAHLDREFEKTLSKLIKLRQMRDV